MNQKIKITEFLLDCEGIENTQQNIKKYKVIWWRNPRVKNKGGLWLTTLGFEALVKADIKYYEIKFEDPILEFENKFIIWLDNTIACPFYLTKKEIFVFGEKTAVQMILFSGNLKLWQKTHIRRKNKEVDNI